MAVVLALLVIASAAGFLLWSAWRVAGWADVRRPPPDAGADDALPDALLDAPGVATIALPARDAPAILRRTSKPGVVLVHGILGFDSLGVGPMRVDYFRRVARRLASTGVDVVAPRLPPLSSVPARAAALAKVIDALPHDRVVVVGHSMGGLDARWAIAHGCAARVSSLVTIGTPHLGTPVADLLARGPVDRARAVVGRLGLPSEAVEWLTTTRLAAFDRAAPDAADVRYACVVASTRDRARVHPLLWATHAYLLQVAGANDGLVPGTSQRWGDVLLEEEVDHWAQIGWTLGWSFGRQARASVTGRRDPAALVMDALARLDALPSVRRRALTSGAAA